MSQQTETWLDYTQAAKRVRKTKHTIQLWRRDGMQMRWAVDENGQRYRIVEEQVLLAWWRQKMQNNPVHQHRLRRAAIERGETPAPIKQRPKREKVPGTSENSMPFRRSMSSQPSGVSEYQGEPEYTSDPIAELLASLPEFKGQAEHAALMKAMEDETPGCDGLETFTRDKFSDPEETEMMRGICRECPVFDLCEAFAIAGKPSAGMWAAMTPPVVKRASARATLAA